MNPFQKQKSTRKDLNIYDHNLRTLRAINSIMTAVSLTPNKYQNEIVIYLLLNYHFSASQSQLSLSKMHLSLPDSCFSKHDIFQFRCYYIDVPSVMLIRFIIVHTCFSPNLCCVLLACPVIKHNYSNYSIYVSVQTYTFLKRL